MASKTQITGQVSGFNHLGYEIQCLKIKDEEIKLIKNFVN